MTDVSVCVTSYNEAAYMRCAIRSVLDQTAINRVKEIIVVDDGFTDGSERHIRELATEDSRIAFIKQPNSGVPAA